MRRIDSTEPRHLSALSQPPRPFLKWAGGKGQLLPHLLARLPARFRNYHEPFLGGGALFFRLLPKGAYLADINPELINCYECVRGKTAALMRALAKFPYEREFFYKVRALDRSETFNAVSPVQRAARFIYLNKTCFNGLYRVNRKGQFNVPFGAFKNPSIFDADVLRACSKAMQGATLRVAAYTDVERHARRGDFVYFDPPYAPLSATANFTSYNRTGFDTVDQIELAELCKRLDRKGVLFMLSNSASPLIRKLYAPFNVGYVEASRAINSNASRRGKVQEIIATNY